MKPKRINIRRLSKILKEEFPEILFAFLFGSARDGSIKSGSDVDLAIYTLETNDKFGSTSRILKIVESEISTDT